MPIDVSGTWVPLVVGVVLLVAGILVVIFRRQVRDKFVPLQRLTFGDKVGDRMQAAPLWGNAIAGCICAAMGLLVVILTLADWRG